MELQFDEEKHIYTLNGKKLISVTQLMQKHGLAPDYSNVDANILKKKASYGTEIHKEIESFIKTGDEGFFEETSKFKEYVINNNVGGILSETMVNNDIVAGTIDLLYVTQNQLHIADIKTTLEVHYSSVSWQLSIYLYLYLSNRKSNLTDYNNYLGHCFHFTKEHNLEVIDIALQPFEEVERLIECEKNNTEFKPSLVASGNISDLKDLYTAITELDAKRKELDEKYNKAIDKIRFEMETRGLKEYIKDGIKIECKGGRKAYTKTNTQIIFNEEEFKEKYPQEYECYTQFIKTEKTTSEVKATPNKITITLLK